MDRTKLSDRKTTVMLAATTRSLGNDVNDYSINILSIRRERHKLRQDISQQLKSKFNQNTPLIVHWYGKRLKYLTGKELVDRLPVIVSGFDTNQLLGVSNFISSTGEAYATAVNQLLEDWGYNI